MIVVVEVVHGVEVRRVEVEQAVSEGVAFNDDDSLAPLFLGGGG